MDVHMDIDTNLVWIDLEMSGLNPTTDVILEIASIVTDGHLNIIEEGPSLVIHQSENVLMNMNQWCRDQHAKSGLSTEVLHSTITVQQAEEKTLAFLREHCHEKKSLLCGNTVWMDRMFLSRYMPRIVDFLFYRIVDVSSIKEVVARWYPDDPHVYFVKQDAHRALLDIRESIAELRYYRKYFFV